MKQVFLLLSFFFITNLFSQDFEKSWNAVIQYENEGKIKSAHEEVKKIYKKATAQKKEVEIIKCFFYNSKYILSLEENAQTIILENLKKETVRASIPSKSILNVVYAKCLNDYLRDNRYNKLYRRTQTDSISDNFLIWTASDFEKIIENTYQKTLENEKVLKQTSLLKYEPIFDFQSIKNFKDQTLFEYILKENIGYYTSKINEWEISSADFANYKAILSGNSNNFIQANFDFVKNPNLKKALSLYQKLEAFNPSAENQLDRIIFTSNYIIESDEKLLIALNAFRKNTQDAEIIKKIQLQNALLYSKLASKEKHPDYNAIAVSILDSLLIKNDRSDIYKLANLKKQKITSKRLTIQLQKYIYNQENTRAFIEYENVDNLKISFYKINQKKLKEFEWNNYKKDSLTNDFISKNVPLKSTSNPLVNKKDYFTHTTEILLPQLETGSYLVYFETEGVEGQKAYDSKTITVSDFILSSETKQNITTYQILNRKTGNPVENAKLKSDYFDLKTDKNGIARYKIEYNYDYKNSDIVITKENDTLQIGSTTSYNDYSDQNSDKSNKLKARVQFFLDRAIYRPGQTVHYKGIAIQKKNDKSSTIANLTLKISIEDAKRNKIKEVEVTTNEFGSFSGQFVLPKNGLTGNFTIIANKPNDTEKDPKYNKKEEKHPFWDNLDDFENSEIRFKVEEYKRPKFEVIFEPNKETYLVNQNITVKGNAKAFAGNNVTGSKVAYTITRFTHYSNYLRPQNYKQPEILTTGETKTDENGKFSIEFIAKPSEKTKKEDLPIFAFEIKADVTDINGETRSNKTIVNVGYQSLKIGVTLPSIIETKDNNSLKISTTNLNGEFIPTQGELKFYFVKENQNKFKPRVWEKPEIAGISDEDFNKLFPYEINEDKNPKLPSGTLIHTIKVDTQKEKTIALDFLSNQKSGYYKVIFTATDKFNNKLESTTNFQLKQSKDLYDTNNPFSITQLNSDPKKDGFITLKLNSVLPNLYLNVLASYKNSTIQEGSIRIKDHAATIKIPIKKEYENSVKVGFQGVFENYEIEDEIEISLKNEESKLDFEVVSFKDKIQPGSPENWSFKIKNNNQKTQSEILASMYDSSLDQFKTDKWENLSFYEYDWNYIDFKSYLGFEKNTSYIKNLNPRQKPFELKNEKTKLIWFGFDFVNNNPYQQRKEYKNQITRKAKKPTNAKIISGTVTSETDNMAMPGVNVIIKGTTRSVQTDAAGYYEIEAASGEVLIFSFLGSFIQTATIGTTKEINIQMKDEECILADVVVEGYNITRTKAKSNVSSIIVSSQTLEKRPNANFIELLQNQVKGLNISTGSGQPGGSDSVILRGTGSLSAETEPLYIIDGVLLNADEFRSLNQDDILSVTVLKDAEATAIYGSRAASGIIIINTKKGSQELTHVKGRTNLSETAFFFPHLTTDKKGIVSFNFTSPEALTSWKLRLIAHQKNTNSGYLEKNVITQKELMVLPNFPRFFREKDSITITSKVSNITKESKNGMAILQLFDATTMQPIDAIASNSVNVKNFTIAPFGNTTVSWKIYIPEGMQGIQYKVLAKSGNFSDGEEGILPVLTNNILVTESRPIWVKGNTKKEYSFENLKNNTSSTLRNHQFTLEYTSNPTWLAIQSLPYLMEYEHECSEQTFARFYANALAAEIINSNPKIATVFENWRKNGKLNSRPEQNEELKSIILAETPWLNDAQSEDEKKNKLALLFDLEKMKNSQETIFNKLKQKQRPSGGFVWFDGNNESEYITSHILSGFGHLKKLNIKEVSGKADEISKNGIPYLDDKFLKNHSELLKLLKEKKLSNWSVTSNDLYYLYTRSFYLEDFPLSDKLKEMTDLCIKNLKKNWISNSLYQKGLASLVLNRFGEKETAKKILVNLKETASNNEDWGMYWIENKAGWYWFQAPIETQSLLIEAFTEIDNDTKSADEMKVWLLKNKQTKNWPTTKSTTEAIYSLLMQGGDWLNVKDNTFIKVGDEKIVTNKMHETEEEAETGYLKLNWKKDEIQKEMASISIENKSKVPGFGGAYWQYFEDLDKIKTNSENVLSVSKELYLKKTTSSGNELTKITAGNTLKLGDLATVRLLITAKEDLEFIHLKDMRASCFEPVNVLSEYKYKDGLGYYMSTKDSATHFFFDSVNKGTYVLEYDIRVNNVGDFSNGITTIESMYAPEFTSHTKGIRVKTTN
ncbi:MAG: MG2 domain-containing protein [Flavobacterium sp.]